MSTADATNANHRQQARLARWLIALALINLAIYVAASLVQAPQGINYVDSFRRGAFLGQQTALGVLAALLPRRAAAGLAAIAVMTLLATCAAWLIHRANFVESELAFARLAITTQAMVWALRMLKGWRIAAPSSIDDGHSGQFRILDMLELTALIAATLACFAAEASGLRVTGIMLFHYSLYHATWLLIGLPIFIVILAPRSPGILMIAALIGWSVLVATGEVYADNKLQHIKLNMVHILFWPAVVPCAVGGTVTIAMNAFALRWLGYRWRWI